MEIRLIISGFGQSQQFDLAKWLSAALHAALSGIGLTTAAIAVDPATFNLAQAKHLAGAALLGALLGLFGLLRQSPLTPKSLVSPPDVPRV